MVLLGAAGSLWSVLFGLVTRVGRVGITELGRVLSYATLSWVTLVAAVRGRRDGGAVVWTQAARQTIYSGFDALWLVSFLAVAGAVTLTTAAFTTFSGFEEHRMVVELLLRVLVKEVAPYVTALVVALRSGSSIAVELGYMSVRGEVEGIESVGIDPIRFLLVPRFLGMLIATVGLNIVFIATAILAAFGTAVVEDIVPARFSALLSYLSALRPSDVVLSEVKAALFGGTTAAVVCYHGLSVHDEITELPRRVARALVEVVLLCTVLASALALIFL